MQLDQATTAFLEMLRASGGKPLYEQTVGEVRDAIRALSLQLGGPRAEVHHVSDRKIPGAAGEVGARLYLPRSAAKNELLPVVIHYHGGGWVAGDLDTHDAIARNYCKQADAAVLSVDYRLAPEHKFPAAAEDAYAALLWAFAHARDWGADPNRIAVTGDSAGGNLAAAVCQVTKARGGPRIAFQALLYPSLDLDPAGDYPSRKLYGGGDYFLSTRDMEWFASLYSVTSNEAIKDVRASPLAGRDLLGLPAALVVTAGFDPLRDEGRAYADRLTAAGVPAEYRCFEGTIHAFVSFSAAIPAGQEAVSLIASRLRKALGGARSL